ncbi:MAG TPA: hypothetical protein VD978_06180 [Azospirillum sp.]|nr:hypothetical protein [Azospirillum sp.]
MAKRTRMSETLFEDIMQGLEQAIAYQRGERVEGVRVHHFERLPDGTVRRVDPTGPKDGGAA